MYIQSSFHSTLRGNTTPTLTCSSTSTKGAGHREGVEGLVACSDHGSDALIWAAGRGDSEHALLDELITLSRGASSNRECHQGDTALTMACSRRENATSI